MNLERVQKYYELIDRELGLESDEDLFGFESDEDDLFGFESDDEDDLFGFESDEEDLFGFESEEENLLEYGFDYGTEGLKDAGKKVWGGVKKVGSMIKNAFKKIYQFIINMIKRIKNAVFGLFRKSNNTSAADPDPVTQKSVTTPALTMPIEFKGYINSNTRSQFNQNLKTFTNIAKRELVGKTISDFIKGTKISDDRQLRKAYRTIHSAVSIIRAIIKENPSGEKLQRRLRISKIHDLIKNKLSEPMTSDVWLKIIDAITSTCVETEAALIGVHPNFKLSTYDNTDIYAFRSEKELMIFNKYMMSYIENTSYILATLDKLAKNIKTLYKMMPDDIDEKTVIRKLNANLKNMANIDTSIMRFSTTLSDAISTLTQVGKVSLNTKRKYKTIYKNF